MNAQMVSNSKFGASIGLLVNIGTHQRAFGIKANAYYTDYFYQFNIGNTFSWNASNFGGRKKYFENRASFGAVLLLQEDLSRSIDFELDALNHQSTKNYGVGFNYLIYTDNIGTSQLSGGWSLHLKNFSMRFENDVFGGQARDRFRTGHLTAHYRVNDFKYTLGLYIWTGETRGSTWTRTSMDKCPNGYRLLEELPYGKTSHGVLYGGLQTKLPYGNIGFFRTGIDAEQIRHGFQNRLTHDLILLPKKIERNTPHYPQLDQEGCATFEKDSIRKSIFFMQFGVNDNWGN